MQPKLWLLLEALVVSAIRREFNWIEAMEDMVVACRQGMPCVRPTELGDGAIGIRKFILKSEVVIVIDDVIVIIVEQFI